MQNVFVDERVTEIFRFYGNLHGEGARINSPCVSTNPPFPYADSRLGDHRHYLDVGDKVLIPNRRKGTIEPGYSTEPHEVVHIKRSMITAKRGDRSLTRNVSLFKRIPDNITRGSSDIDFAADTEHAEDQSDFTPVSVAHHATEHQPRVDAPTVMPVTIVQLPQLTSVPNNDDGL